MNLNRALLYSAARYALLAGLIFAAVNMTATSMHTALASPYSVARNFLLAGLIFIVVKLLATVFQIFLVKTRNRRQLDTALFRTVYLAGKATPAFAAASFCVSAILRHDQRNSWIYGLLTVFGASLAAFVVHLQRQGYFSGVPVTVSEKHK